MQTAKQISEQRILLAGESEHTARLPFVSIIIPVFNDPHRLKMCLEALEVQTYPQDLYEVIVVDNGSEQPVSDIVDTFKQAVVLFEERPSQFASRNTGLMHARGEILAFTDADCIPSHNWLERGVHHLLHAPSGCGVVGGHVAIFYQDPARPTPMELYECVKAFPQQYFVEEEHFSVTANLFTFKFVMDKVGPFNEKLKSSGDVEWGQRVYAAGYGLRYANDVCVLHPARYSLRDYSQKAFRVIDGFRVMHPRSRFLKELLREMLPPFPDAFRIWKNRRLFGVKQRLMAIAVLFYARYLKVYYRIRVLIRPPGKWEARV